MSDQIIPTTTDTVDRQQEFINLVNKTNNKNYALQDMSIGSPVQPEASVAAIKNRNTQVLLIAKLSSPYNGEKTLYYNRLSLGDINELVVASDQSVTSSKVIDAINQEAGTDLKLTDVNNVSMPALIEPIIVVNIEAKQGSLKYTGNAEINVVTDDLSSLSALSIFVHQTIPSFS